MHRLLSGTVVLLSLIAAPSAARAQADDAPGVIEIQSPVAWAPGARGLVIQRTNSLRVSGLARHPIGVDRVVVNDQRFFLEGLADGAWRFDGYVPVTAESDSVTVTVVTRDGSTFSETYALELALPDRAMSEVERFEVARGDFQGERWAVIVGISEYQHPGIQDLEYAHRDAQEFERFLRSEQSGLGGFDSDKILLLTNEDATYRRLRSALFTFLKQPTEDDVVYVFWAGHGTPDKDRMNDLYLLPHDVDANDIAGTAIPMEDLQDALDRTLAREKIIITDACHSAGVGFGGTRAGGINQINDAFVQRLAMSSGGLVAITSSSASEISSEGRQWGGGHGVFTYHLLEGLRGEADANGDRIVDFQEAYEYVRERVRRSTNNAQTPTISQTPFNLAWPMSMVLDDDYVAPIIEDDEQGGGNAPRGAAIVDILEEPWAVPDSVNAFMGVEDTIKIHLGGRSGPLIDGTLLGWGSSNSRVATVTDDGRIRAVSPGVAAISASLYDKRTEVAVRVYDRPLQVEFTPRDDTLEVVRGDEVRLSAAMELPTGEVVRGVLPNFHYEDSLVVALSRDDNDRLLDGQFRAVRVGAATITGTLAGEQKTWVFDVKTPGLQIEGVPSILLSSVDLDVRARYTRGDGTLLGEALSVTWESSDTSVVDVVLGGIRAGRPGRARLIASVSTSADTIDVSVLGDLLISGERNGVSSIYSYSLESGDLVPLLQDEWGGAHAILSPDGSAIAFLAKRDDDPAPRVYLMEIDGSNVRQLVEEKGRGFLGLGSYYEDRPFWSFDSRHVFFSTNREGNYDVYSIPPDGDMDELVRVSRDGAIERSVAASLEGPTIAFERVNDQRDSDVIVTLADGTEGFNLTEDRRADGSTRTRLSESDPWFVPGGGLLLIEESTNRSEGEALVAFDLGTRVRTGEVVGAQPNEEIIYTVSPDGTRVAYQQRPRNGRGDGQVVIASLDGTALSVFSLPAGVRLVSIGWGALPAADGGLR